SPRRYLAFNRDSVAFIMNGKNFMKGTFYFTENSITIIFTDSWEGDQWHEMPGPTIARLQYDDFLISGSFNVTRWTEENQWSEGAQSAPQIEYHGVWRYQ
ncbi:MAG: hypothetical protein FWE09_08920, partial [Treponema sp.]|nr:hypothetical protein [Treponema sp.]